MELKGKKQGKHYSESHWKKVRDGDITPVTSTSEEEEVGTPASKLDISIRH